MGRPGTAGILEWDWYSDLMASFSGDGLLVARTTTATVASIAIYSR
jgi:hypothetical protein